MLATTGSGTFKGSAGAASSAPPTPESGHVQSSAGVASNAPWSLAIFFGGNSDL
jgi:hypothetical protein